MLDFGKPLPLHSFTTKSKKSKKSNQIKSNKIKSNQIKFLKPCSPINNTEKKGGYFERRWGRKIEGFYRVTLGLIARNYMSLW